MSSQINLAELFSNFAVQDFANALRNALNDKDHPDYSSLVELEYTETKEQFLETAKKFLRRYDTYLRRKSYDTYSRRKRWTKPKEKNLIELGNLIDKYGVKVVRNALISLSLCEKKSERE
ncbi:hypothetical protein H5T58_01340 [Candidatus Parcubacteria bacterium]|nr:hypothetical protein [Candidatus Parcubacteria bacterium]